MPQGSTGASGRALWQVMLWCHTAARILELAKAEGELHGSQGKSREWQPCLGVYGVPQGRCWSQTFRDLLANTSHTEGSWRRFMKQREMGIRGLLVELICRSVWKDSQLLTLTPAAIKILLVRPGFIVFPSLHWLLFCPFLFSLLHPK